MLAGTDDGRVLAHGSGDTDWRLVSAYPGIGAIVCLAVEPNEGAATYAGTSTGNLLMSEDGGASWSYLQRPVGVFQTYSLAVVPGSPEHVYMDTWGIGGAVIWVSRDKGLHWQPVPDDKITRELAMLFTQGDRLYAAGRAGFFETADGGATWRYASELGAPLALASDLAVSQAGGPTYAAVEGAVFATSDPEAEQWARGTGLLASIVRDVKPDPSDPDVAYPHAVGQTGRVGRRVPGRRGGGYGPDVQPAWLITPSVGKVRARRRSPAPT